jgi:hypothetical protein
LKNHLPQLLKRGASIRATFPVQAFPLARQGSFQFFACGRLPMRGLSITFHAPDGTVLRRISPLGEAAQAPHPRWLGLALCIEFLLRLLLRRQQFYHLDLGMDALRHPALGVRIENRGQSPVAIGALRLRTTEKARDRPVTNRHAIEGYARRISAAAGTCLPLYIHAPSRIYSLKVVRYGAAEEALFHDPCVEGHPQDYRADAFENGARWRRSYTLALGAGWRSGLYSARLSAAGGASFELAFIVRNPRPPAAGGLAVLASTNTWQAYNNWGGASIYVNDIDDGLQRADAFIVHSQRPNPAASPLDGPGHLARGERYVLGWLEKNNISYDLVADIDLHESPGLLAPYQTLLINTHSEYWTEEMYEALETFQARGGNLIYLSGNGLYWKALIRGQRMEVRSDHSAHTLAGEAGGRWRALGRPEWRMLGIGFTKAGGRSRYRPYRVLAPEHWIFEHTGVREGDLIGAKGLNGAASGWEIDKLDRTRRPPGLVHLAKGANRWGSGADLVYFPHAGGGAVFSTGSITFGGSLAVDPVLSRMLLNVIARFSRSPSRARVLAHPGAVLA